MVMDKTITKNYLYTAAAVLATAAVAVGVYAYGEFSVPKLSYQSDEYDISFRYPETYALSEHDVEGRHTIVLVDKEALAAASLSNQNPGEGPTTITFDVIDNSENLAPSAWVKADSASNFQLSPDGTLASSTRDGAEAVAYVWDGLYRGESYVFDHGSRLVMATVTMLEPTDTIKKDFERILRSLVLQ